MDPQQRTGYFPILKGTTLDKPRRGAFMVRDARSVLVYGRVWRTEPLSKILSQLVPCKGA